MTYSTNPVDYCCNLCSGGKQIDLRDLIDSRPLSPLQIWLVAMIVAVIMLDGLDLQLASFAAPLIMKQWVLSKGVFAHVFAAAMFGMACGAITGGWLGDRLGRRPALIGSVGFFALATMSCGAVSHVDALIGLRFLSGLGFGAAFPAATALVAEWMPRRAASQAVSLMALGVPLGGLVGAAVVAPLLPAIGWRNCFLLAGLCTSIMCVILIAFLSESPAYLLRLSKLASTRKLMSRAWPHLEVPEIQNAGSLLQDAGTTRIFSVNNLRINIGLWLAFFSNSLATYLFISWIPTLLTAMGLSLSSAIHGSLFYNFAAISGAVIPAFLTARFGSRTTLLALACTGVAGASIIGYLLINASFGAPNNGFVSFSGIILEGICIGGTQTGLYVLAAHAYEVQNRSTGIGYASAFVRTGGIFSSFVGGFVLTKDHGLYFFPTVAAILAFVMLAVVIINRHISSRN